MPEKRKLNYSVIETYTCISLPPLSRFIFDPFFFFCIVSIGNGNMNYKIIFGVGTILPIVVAVGLAARHSLKKCKIAVAIGAAATTAPYTRYTFGPCDDCNVILSRPHVEQEWKSMETKLAERLNVFHMVHSITATANNCNKFRFVTSFELEYWKRWHVVSRSLREKQ